MPTATSWVNAMRPSPEADRRTGHAVFADGFSAPLLDPSRSTPAGVSARYGGPAEKRYAVYRNNVTTSLADALADIFPAVRRLVGDAFFSGMAIAFVRNHPPRSRLLFEYGRDFPAFIDAFEPARGLPYLADVAAIERAWLDAYHAADAEPLSPSNLAALPPEDLPACTFVPHPAMRILRSRYAAFSIHEANRGEETNVGPVRGDVPEDTLVTRPGLSVQLRRLPDGAAAFLTALASGAPFRSAVEAGFSHTEAFDPSAAITIMLESGSFAAPGKKGP